MTKPEGEERKSEWLLRERRYTFSEFPRSARRHDQKWMQS